MKYSDLLKCVEEHNQIWFSEGDLGRRIDPQSIENCNNSCVTGLCEQTCGFTTNASDVAKLVDAWLLLQGKNQKQRRMLAGSVVDVGSNPQDDLPVVLAVGINYGQGDKYADNPVPLQDDTRLRTKTSKVIDEIRKRKCRFEEMPNFHLVAANFFPWITKNSWSKMNSIEEAILMNCAGHNDPVQHIVSLINSINPDLVIFHGANNAVPGLGWKVLRALCSSGSSLCHFVFSDNLAPPASLISNAVLIQGIVGRRNLHCVDFDA